MIISNTSPLINLASIRMLHILEKLYGEIIIPFAVWDEIVIKGKGQPGSEEVKNANWIKKEAVKNIPLIESLTLSVDRGEAEVIALAKEKKAEFLIIDERMAREIARHLGLNYIGLLGVLREAKSRGMIKSIKKYMDSLRTSAGFWISDDVYKEILLIEKEGK